MAAQEVLNALNQIYDLGDSLDDAGIGTLALTNGNKTTREACRLDIAHFLVYVGNGASQITDGQASLLGIVLGSQYGQVTPEAFRNVAKDVGVPEADKSLSILTFCHCDQVLSRKNGTKSTSLTDVLVNLYESVGQLMVALNENAVSRSRYDSYIREMKSVIASHLEDEDDSSDKAPIGKEPGTHEDGKKTKSSGKKKSSTKKTNSGGRDGKKVASRGQNSGRGQVPAEDVLIPGKYKGIHNVTGKPETISPFGTWTIDVPAGFSYTMDPECASRSMMGMGPSYSLQIQTTEDCDFSSAYDSSFGLAIYPSSVVWVNIEDGGEDLRSSYAQSTLRDLQNDGFRNYTVLVHTPDVLVQYDNSNRDSEAITINFQIICAGVNAGTNGQIDVQGPDMYKLEEKALEMLASVGSIHQEYNTDQYMPFAIPPKVSPIFKTTEVIEIAPAVKLPIPDGFHATNDQSQTNGRSFIIVPEEYPFSKDPMQATVGISGANGQINLPDRYQYGTMLGMILSKLPDGVFSENSKMWFSRISDSYAAFFQENYDENAPTWALYRILLFAGSQAFVLSMRINFGQVKLPFLATSIDARNIVRHWLYHIAAKNTLDKDIPVASPKVPDIFHEHFTLVTSGQYTTHRDADFVGQPIRMLMEKHDSTGDEAYGLMEIPKDSYKLDADARRLATVFRMDEDLFDPYRDTEAMIRLGMFHDVKLFHALRSLAWTVSCKADQEGRTLGSYSFEELNEIGAAISNTPLNYKTESWCSGLCSHYDWHVFYVPDSYIESECRGRTDLRLLCNKENRGGNSIHIIGPLFNMMDRTNDIISRCEETLESLEALRKDLIDLLPVMQTIYDGFMEDRDRSQPLEGVLAEALTAWCALAIAAKEPFYSEEAADTPEADAGLDGPMERPTDDLDAAPAARKTSTVSKPVAKKPSRPLPAGEVLDLGGATVVEAGKFSGNMTLKNIVIPEGVTEIGEYAFYTCMFLETVVLPKSLKKIGKMAFMSCRSLRQVEIPEGVEEIRDHAFGATNNLKEVHLPDSLKVVDRYIFGMGGDSPYATAYMSGELVKRLQANQDSQWLLSAVSARRYVIDGKGYENMYDYWKPESSGASGFVHGFPLPMNHDEREKRKEQYRPDMEAAVSEGKSLDEMIEVGRKATSFLRNEEAYEKAISCLDRNATVTFKDKHFVLTGFGDNEEEVIAEIEKRGGEVHSSMVKKADYLVVCLMGDPGAGKLNKALEWRQKGATNLIVSDYQMWQGMLGGKSVRVANTKKSDKAPELPGHADKKVQSAPVSQSKEKVANAQRKASSKPASTKPATVKRDSYTGYISDDVIIEFWFMKFVFAGVYDKGVVLEEQPEVKAILAETGELAARVSGKTDYLVIKDTDSAPENTMAKAAELIDSGKPLKIITIETLRRALRGADIVRKRVRFGEYPKGKPISWFVMERKGNELLLLSEYGLDCQSYNDMEMWEELQNGDFLDMSIPEEKKKSWEYSDMRNWLNNIFVNKAFSTQERLCIMPTVNDNLEYSWSLETGKKYTRKPSTTDRVFLLSAGEALRLFPRRSDRVCRPTEFALKRMHEKDKYDEVDFTEDTCAWWLRGPFTEEGRISGIRQNRDICECQLYPSADGICIRPAIRVNVNLLNADNWLTDKGSYSVMARIQPEEEAKREAEEKARREADEQAKREQARREAEERAKREAEERAKREAEAQARREQEKREREEAERRAAEERKKAERERINAQIYDLSQEMDSLKGLFAGMKRKKLQKQIDELNEQLRRLQ